MAFFFYLAAVICFVLAAAGEAWKYGSLGRRGSPPRLLLVPLGLALFVIPTMWTVGTQAF
ncbi:MAG: hypothetical protein ACR2MO_03490 [Acidimicrobiales bacterium]